MPEKITDTRILNMLKTIALEVTIAEGYSETHYCFFQREEALCTNAIDNIVHTPECQTTIARTILREQEMPLNAYRVTYEFYHNYEGYRSYDGRTYQSYWEKVVIITRAFSQQEVEECYKDIPELRRNVQIEFIKEL